MAEIQSLPENKEYELTSHSGSTLLQPVSDVIGLPIDQVNFIICQLVTLLFGIYFRTRLAPQYISPTVRHVIEILGGLILAVFCFGSQVIHLAIHAFASLALMHFLKPGLMEKAVFIFAMGYLCFCHIYRMYCDYGGYTLDITGPLMISTQRLTSLAYNIADGKVHGDSKLSKHAQAYGIKSFPTLLEFTSYTFSFHMILCGPFCFFKDYLEFIHGSCYMPNSKTPDAPMPAAVNPSSALKWYFLQIVLCALVMQVLQPLFPCSYLLTTAFIDSNIFYKMTYIVAATSLIRAKYYFAWKLSEAVNVCAGLGFNGYDEEGNEKWDLIDNADILKVELSTSLKVLLDNWNKMTTQWLRYVVYERYHSTMAVFLFSAFWHGFYAGYYWTFVGGAVFVHCSRLVRRKFRPMFQSSSQMALFYDALTFLATRLSLAYLTFPFVLLEFWVSLDVYRQIYFWMHLLVIGAMVVLTLTEPKPPRKEENVKQS